MSKSKPKGSTMAKVQEQSTAVAPRTVEELPPALREAFNAKGAPRGYSTAAEDNTVPMIYILQALSPQVNRRNPDYIEGAEPGDFWLRNFTPPIVKGETGFLFQPCYFSKDWVEWVPRTNGGGLVGRHKVCPTDVREVPDPEKPRRFKLMRPNGNEIRETRYHAGFVKLPDGRTTPYLIPLTSTGHTFSKNWTTAMGQRILPEWLSAMFPAGKQPDGYLFFYRLRTRERSNADGTWFTWEYLPDECVFSGPEDTMEGRPGYIQYMKALALFNALAAGEKVFGEEDDTAEAAAATGDI